MIDIPLWLTLLLVSVSVLIALAAVYWAHKRRAKRLEVEAVPATVVDEKAASTALVESPMVDVDRAVAEEPKEQVQEQGRDKDISPRMRGLQRISSIHDGSLLTDLSPLDSPLTRRLSFPRQSNAASLRLSPKALPLSPSAPTPLPGYSMRRVSSPPRAPRLFVSKQPSRKSSHELAYQPPLFVPSGGFTST